MPMDARIPAGCAHPIAKRARAPSRSRCLTSAMTRRTARSNNSSSILRRSLRATPRPSADGLIRTASERSGGVMKKLINGAETVLEESLDGFAAAHGDILLLGLQGKVV